MRYDPVEIAAAAMFFISATEQPWEEICIFFFWRESGRWMGREWDGGMGGEGGGGESLDY